MRHTLSAKTARFVWYKSVITFRDETISFLSCFHAGPTSTLIELEFGDVCFSRGRKTEEPGGKSSEKGENNNILNPHFAPGTWATLRGGDERSHYCAIHAHAIPCCYETCGFITTSALVYRLSSQKLCHAHCD